MEDGNSVYIFYISEIQCDVQLVVYDFSKIVGTGLSADLILRKNLLSYTTFTILEYAGGGCPALCFLYFYPFQMDFFECGFGCFFLNFSFGSSGCHVVDRANLILDVYVREENIKINQKLSKKYQAYDGSPFAVCP